MLHKGGARKYYKSLFSKQSSFHFRKVLSLLGNSWSQLFPIGFEHLIWEILVLQAWFTITYYIRNGGARIWETTTIHHTTSFHSSTIPHPIHNSLHLIPPSIHHTPYIFFPHLLEHEFHPLASSIVHHHFQPSTINSMASTSIDRVFVLCSMSG